MVIKNKTDLSLPIDDWSNIYVVADFDRTITNGSSKTSWSILATSDEVPKEYIKDRQDYYDIYRPIEIDETMDFESRSAKVKEWFRLHIELFVKYGIREELFEKAANDLRVMEFRSGAKEFLKFLYDHDIPLVIISAGIGNFIISFLKNHDCFYDNIYVASNIIVFKDGVASGVDANIIHSLNKNEVSLPKHIKKKIEGRENVILLGDQISDLNMVNEEEHENVLKVVFVADDAEDLKSTYEDVFDVVVGKGEGYVDLMKVLEKEGI